MDVTRNSSAQAVVSKGPAEDQKEEGPTFVPKVFACLDA